MIWAIASNLAISSVWRLRNPQEIRTARRHDRNLHDFLHLELSLLSQDHLCDSLALDYKESQEKKRKASTGEDSEHPVETAR